MKIAGCDLGKAVAKFAVGHLDGEGGVVVDSVSEVPGGQSVAAFVDWYRREDIASFGALAATGIGADALVEPVLCGLPSDACLEAALPLVAPEGPLNLLWIGARGYGVLGRTADGRVSQLSNDKCSSGTGETMVKLASRFGLSIDEADALALAAAESVPITARCSVFAKSEMTHHGNAGKSADVLFRGYFDAIATTVAALLERVRVDGPVLAIGGGARLLALRRALENAVGQEVVVPERAQLFEALGALQFAADHAGLTKELPSDPEELVRSTRRRFRKLEASSDSAHRVVRLPAPKIPRGAAKSPLILGLDLGSTGSKAVLVSMKTGVPVRDAYDRTRGNPVDATQRLIRTLLKRKAKPNIRAIAVTGSGRVAAATVLRAVFPDALDRIVVANEIVAHATAAIRCDDRNGADLSVVEIGGQDAKFIQIRGGQIVESDMNKACSAGTGSFLEEQAALYGVSEIEDFTRLAEEAQGPPDLGQMCTVFVAEAAADAHAEGADLPELFGGFQYAVIHNYLHRVMGQRTFGERVFFQGKPATGPALAWTLAAVSEREVIVPPNPGAMGAWGVALVAADLLGTEVEGPSFELAEVLDAAVVKRAEFTCRDQRCATMCVIERATVEVADDKRKVFSGGACPKYEIAASNRPKLPVGAPAAFEQRAELQQRYCEDRAGRTTVGIPVVGAIVGVLPWLVTFLEQVGLGVQVLRPDRDSLSRGEERCYSYDACAPVKIAHAVVDAPVDAVFFPKLLSLPDSDDTGGGVCPSELSLPELVEASLQARGRSVQIARPQISLDGSARTPKELARLAKAISALGGQRRRLALALRRADRTLREYEEGLKEIGRNTLGYGARNELDVVVVCGSLHVIHDDTLNAGVARVLRDNGVLALPMDCYPIPSGTPALETVPWIEPRRALRTALAARARGGVYPLLLSSFGCGPASFTEQLFGSLLKGTPHTALETDGHGGTAGYVTRIQAFLHTVHKHDRQPSPPREQSLSLFERTDTLSQEELRGRQLVIPAVCERLGTAIAATYRSIGFDAVAAPDPGPENYARGVRDCSGKECVPYQMIWSGFRAHLEANGVKRPVLMQVAGQSMCRNCMFAMKDRLSLQRLGYDDVDVQSISFDDSLGWGFMATVWMAMVSSDLLYQMTAYTRPYERFEGQVDALYHQFSDQLDALAEKPHRTGILGAASAVKRRSQWTDLVDRAAWQYAEILANAPSERRSVLLSGDAYLRLADFPNGGLIRSLNRLGLSVIVEPTSVLAEYMAHERLAELLGLPQDRLPNAVLRTAMAPLRRMLTDRVRALHPWLPDVHMPSLIEESRRLIDEYPKGEAPIAIGSVLLHWKEKAMDGAVVVSPWGCGPGLAVESLLRHQSEIPMLFVYSDGTPLDERRLTSFAFKLRTEGADSLR